MRSVCGMKLLSIVLLVVGALIAASSLIVDNRYVGGGVGLFIIGGLLRRKRPGRSGQPTRTVRP